MQRIIIEPDRFQPRSPWWGGDLQTLRNFLTRSGARLDAWPSSRLVLPLGDGDALAASYHANDQKNESSAPRPLALIIHGLAGCEDSAYVRASAAWLLCEGFPVLRLNLRGAGPSRAFCRDQYHAGRSGDLRQALAALPPSLMANGIVAVGFSLGGNMLLKYLGEEGGSAPFRAAAVISAPIDLAEAGTRLMAPRNALYHLYMITAMKQEAVAAPADLSPGERAAIRRVRSVYAFDDTFIAPRNGFAGADDYYAHCSAINYLDGVRVPTLVIHALDDPWIPPRPYRAYDWTRNPALIPALTHSGGHVGFHAHDHAAPWHNRVVARYFADVAAG
jgi:hypothetical protein